MKRETLARSTDPRVLFRTVLTAYAESDLRNLANETVPESLTYPHDGVGRADNSCGIMQQRTPWWGTVADQMDPAKATGMFLDALLQNRLTDDPVRDAWDVQHWGAPDPAVDLAGFRAHPGTQNYTRRLDEIPALLADPHHFGGS